MVDGFHALKFFHAHKAIVGDGNCLPCAQATLHGIETGLEDEESFDTFEELLCPDMRQAVEHILQAELITHTVMGAIEKVEARFATTKE